MTKLDTMRRELRERVERALRGESSLPVKRQLPPLVTAASVLAEIGDRKRLRQSSKPLCNKLEASWGEHLKRTLPPESLPTLRPQAIQFRLCNGSQYRPDWTALVAGKPIAWECKGGSKMHGASKGVQTVKLAASLWPEWTWIFVWRERGEWFTQAVLS